MIFLDFKGTE